LNRDWLTTVDLQQYVPSLTALTVSDEDRKQAVDRLNAVKNLAQGRVSLTKESGNQKGLQAYLQALRDLILEHHDTGAQTLVIVNRVERAQRLFDLVREQRDSKDDLLIHARFRAAERARQAFRLREVSGDDRIIIATQAIEAGVDISAKTLVTELAPWASLVQRFGRCNRYGEHNADGAQVLWVDIEDDADALPYANESLDYSREKLAELVSASPSELPAVDEPRPITAVLRRRDLLDLFNTDPDLSGFDVNVSDYIRDSGTPGVQVFWRDFKEDPNDPLQRPPVREELCPVSIGQAKAFAKRKGVVLWQWDALDRKWVNLSNDRALRPGMTLLSRAADGGYHEATGFEPNRKEPVTVVSVEQISHQDAFGDDRLSLQKKPIALVDHLSHVAEQAKGLCASVGETLHAKPLIRAARWHDLGKAHPVFDASMHACNEAPVGLLAKSPCRTHHSRSFFRHELASMLAWLAQHEGEADADLIAYLIAAHHGKVRMSLRAMPTERADMGVKRFARGIWEGDTLPALEFDGERSNETTLRLALMEIGEGEQGASWTERTSRLLDQYGPFQLAWLETLVRLADWRASAAEQC
jgi:CRISPR-associated endonuclease/helicase Cas3